MDKLLQFCEAADYLNSIFLEVLNDAVQVCGRLVVHILSHLLKNHPVVLVLLILLLQLLYLVLDEEGTLLGFVETDDGETDQCEPEFVRA